MKIGIIYRGQISDKHFIVQLERLFKKIEVVYIEISQLWNTNISDIDLVFNNSDLNGNTYRHNALADIHPSFLINGRIGWLNKTSVAETFEKVFGVKLNLYKKDVETYAGEVFLKEQHQTVGKYAVSSKPNFGNGFINQKLIGEKGRVFGIHFCLGKLLYGYEIVTNKDFAKFGNAEQIIFLDFKKVDTLLKPYKENLLQVAQLVGVDFGRFDITFDAEGTPYVLDVNSRPFENNYFNEEFKKTHLTEKTAKVVEALLIKKNKENKNEF